MAFQCVVCECLLQCKAIWTHVRTTNKVCTDIYWLYVCQLVSDCLKHWQFFVCFNFWHAILGATRFRLRVWSPKPTIRKFEAGISFGVKGASELESISSFHCNRSLHLKYSNRVNRVTRHLNSWETLHVRCLWFKAGSSGGHPSTVSDWI